jgi:hypothetical protein
MKILTKLQHLKIFLFGDRELETAGKKKLHCVKCDDEYLAFLTYSGYYNKCEKCRVK